MTLDWFLRLDHRPAERAFERTNYTNQPTYLRLPELPALATSLPVLGTSSLNPVVTFTCTSSCASSTYYTYTYVYVHVYLVQRSLLSSRSRVESSEVRAAWHGHVVLCSVAVSQMVAGGEKGRGTFQQMCVAECTYVGTLAAWAGWVYEYMYYVDRHEFTLAGLNIDPRSRFVAWPATLGWGQTGDRAVLKSQIQGRHFSFP